MYYVPTAGLGYCGGWTKLQNLWRPSSHLCPCKLHAATAPRAHSVPPYYYKSFFELKLLIWRPIKIEYLGLLSQVLNPAPYVSNSI